MVFFIKFVAAMVLVLHFSSALYAVQEQPPEGQDPQEQKLLQIARQAARVAGGARYCKLQNDDIEEFIGKAEARIALVARDDYQKILGRLEFKNILAAAAAKEPEGGCDKFAVQFDSILRNSR